jgi:PAS domain S-box-containing protein
MDTVPSSSPSPADDVLAQWQRFVHGLACDDTLVRPVIRESWQRSAAAGVPHDPAGLTPPRVSAAELRKRLAASAELIGLAWPHLEWLAASHAALPHVVFLVDADGIVLRSTGNDADALDSRGIAPGTDWSEAAVGTNAAGTALAAAEAVAIDGAEHFSRPLHARACAGAPVRGPTGDVVGALVLSAGTWDSPAERLLVVAHAAYAIEQELRFRDTLGRTNRQLEIERRLAEEHAQRLAALEALRESEARYHLIAANVPGLVYQFVYGADGTKGYTYVSEGARTVFGVAPEDALRDPSALLSLIHPAEYSHFVATARAAAADLGSFRWEGRVVLPSGEERFVHMEARDHVQPDGGVASDGLVMDVTELHRAARRLEESEERYRSLFEHHPDAVYSLDTEGRFLSANPACETISGYAPEELLGGSFAPHVIPERSDAVRAHFQAAIAGTAQRFETVIRHKHGYHVELDVTNIPMVVGAQVVGVFGIARDLTAQRALEAQLRQAQKMEAVGRLAGGVAHDFNNILAAITGFAELVRDNLAPNSPDRADVDEILKGARRAAALTRQLLAFSRKQVLQPEVLELNQVVRETATRLGPLLGAALHVVTLPAPSVVPVFADRTQLEQVLMNLALNARDAMPRGGTLTMEVAVAPAAVGGAPEAVLVVSDTGVGMAPAVKARVFEPFFTTKPAGRGTGLGLATVHGIVEQSGGTVCVSSREGHGTTFTITLPLAEPAARGKEVVQEPPAEPVAAHRDRGVGTVLLVEDEAAVRAIARRVLERAGYQVLTARHGADALRVLDEHGAGVDVLLSDVVMPEMGGVELAARVAERLPGVRVVLMSGYADADLGAIGQDGMVDGFVAKPFTAESLLETLQQVARSS